MFSNDEASRERAAAYASALKEERISYERRIAALEAGVSDNERLSNEQLEARIKGVDAELKRVEKLKPKGGK
jgi:outer membrane protein TolC